MEKTEKKEDRDKKIMMNEIISKVKIQIIPNEKKMLEKISKFLKKLKKSLSEINNIDIFVGGSIGKKTFLKNVHDCDIFVRFDYEKYKNEDISSILYRALKRMSVKRVHGSRDYYQKKFEGLLYEMVPVLKITDWKKALNVTDMSPLHVKWVEKKLNNNEKLKQEVKLSRSFFKANNLYGAETHIQGFSGHVLDILTINYGSFLKFIESISKIKEGTIIDVEHFYKTKKSALENIDKSKLSPLIIIDPVMPSRNAGAAISKKVFEKAKSVCKNFLESPSFSFFEKEEIKIGEIIEKAIVPENKFFIVLKAIPLKKKEDVAATKMLKAFRLLKHHLELNDFSVSNFDWIWKKKYGFCFFLTDEEISETYIREGPPLKSKNDVKKFKSVNEDVFEKDGKLYANIKRKFIRPELFIRDFSRKDFLKDKIKSLKIFNIKRHDKDDKNIIKQFNKNIFRLIKNDK